ncbi:hypothetical protein Tfer_3304 [Thermincola ferriacetica]|uniref:Uncharacterized protein n=1 Tax=Thermincola ferriacetica TaxID=281456 RepID=A0A0L6VZ91_9FIRM|nr:hypothetical protein Tfer_3304 [Thermincola ferriacetica]
MPESLHGHPVYSGSPIVGFDGFICSLQVIHPVYLVHHAVPFPHHVTPFRYAPSVLCDFAPIPSCLFRASLALWQSYPSLRSTPAERTYFPAGSSPPVSRSLWHSSRSCLLFPSLGPSVAYLDLPSSLRSRSCFWLTAPHCNQVQCPPGFLLQSVTSFHGPGVFHYYGLICHPTPLRPALVSPLVWAYPLWGWCRASPVKPACLKLNPSVLTPQVIQLLGFPTQCKVTHLTSQPRFACAMFQIPPSASFRPHRWPVTPLPTGCLPAG